LRPVEDLCGLAVCLGEKVRRSKQAKAKQKPHLPTFCVITHDIMSARRVADYINVLWKGRIVEAGPAEEMLNSENPFIRQFLSGESQGPLTMD
jgi:phospholipid/cholesterol/gamma-HCH transport system ATP-binding protein